VSDRDTLVGNVASNLRRGTSPRAQHDTANRVASHPRHPPEPEGAWPQDLLVGRFSAELTAIAGKVHRVTASSAAIDTVMDLCQHRGAERVLSWAPEEIGLPGLRDAFAAAGISADDGWLPEGEEDRRARLRTLASISVGLTGAIAGIAESGTIAVVSGAGRSRLASLLPPVHIAVLRATRLYPSLGTLIDAHAGILEWGSNLVLITGPSRTADIEMTLTRGVHGPGEVHVVLLDG